VAIVLVALAMIGIGVAVYFADVHQTGCFSKSGTCDYR
jgi:hypothetical protein